MQFEQRSKQLGWMGKLRYGVILSSEKLCCGAKCIIFAGANGNRIGMIVAFAVFHGEIT